MDENSSDLFADVMHDAFVDSVRDALPSSIQGAKDLANQLVQECVILTGTGCGAGLQRVRVSQGGRGGGVSQKLGNIFIDLKKLLKSAPSLVLTAYSVTGPEWLAPFAILTALITVMEGCEITLSKDHAMVLYGMWLKRDTWERIDRAAAYRAVEEYFVRNGDLAPSHLQFDVLVRDLQSLRCLRLEENDMIWLCESVAYSY